MKKDTEIEGSWCTLFSNAQYISYQTSILTLVSEAGQDVTHVGRELIEPWRALITTELEAAREPRAHRLTEQLRELDERRNELIVYLFGIIRCNRKALKPAKREAARCLTLITVPFRGLQTQNMHTKSGNLISLTDKLQEEAAAADIATLDLTEEVAELAAINEQYGQLVALRSSEKEHRRMPPVKKLRKQSDTIYRKACSLIEAGVLINTETTDRQAAKQLIRNINQVTANSLKSFRQSRSHRKPRGEEEKIKNVGCVMKS